jgi:uncharacterized protein
MRAIVRTALIALGLLLATIGAGWTDNIEDFKLAMQAQAQGDYATASRIFRSLAAQGISGAKWALGLMYLEGRGVPRDYGAALEWYRKASDQGHPLAEYDVGTMYDRGLGVTQNYVEAAKWFHRSAEQGYSRAMVNLGALYSLGEGVSQDYVEAYKWFSLAAVAGDYLDTKQNEPVKADAARRRDEISRQMTTAQLTEAQTRVRQWSAKPEPTTNANALANAAPSLPPGRVTHSPGEMTTPEKGQGDAWNTGSVFAAGLACEQKGFIREGQAVTLMAISMQRMPSMYAEHIRDGYREGLERSAIYSSKSERWLTYNLTRETCGQVEFALKQYKTGFDAIK